MLYFVTLIAITSFHIITLPTNLSQFSKYSQTCVQQPPLGLEKIGRCLEGSHCLEDAPESLLTGLEVVLNTGLHCIVIVIDQARYT